LTWAQVDRTQGIVRLEVGETKNDEARTFYFDEELTAIMKQQWEQRKDGKIILPYVFLNRYGKDKVKRFDKSWKKACKKAKIGDRIFHDLRRTAVRNMVRSGTPEIVAMKISGHKSRSVFDRYNITSESDIMEASRRQEAYLNSQAGTISGTIHDFEAQKEKKEAGLKP
jgi:integrase